MKIQTLAFFPWLELKEQLDTPYFKTVAYRKDVAPGPGPEQAVIQDMLSPYKNAGRSVASCTLLLLKDQELLEEFSEKARKEAFIYAELIAFCGLSNRTFFNTVQIGYVNRDDFTFYIQSRQEDSGAVVINSRRRDGNKTSIFSRDVLNFPRPAHLGTNFPVDIDRDLLHSLIAAQETAEWERYWEAIIGFGRSNTDNPSISDEAEIVLMIGAFQRLCDVDHSVDKILPVLSQIIPPRNPIPPSSCKRFTDDKDLLQKYCRSNSMLEAWMRDFFAIRGQKGHGRIEIPFKTAWASHEHLLLGSFLFPLLLKSILATEGHYKLSTQDKSELDLFEELAAARLFEVNRKEGEGEIWPWNDIHESAFFRRLGEEAYDEINKSRTPS